MSERPERVILLARGPMATDPRFATNGARVVNREALTEVLNARFADEDGHELIRWMLASGLPAGPVLNIDEAMAADHTAHRKMVTKLGAYRGLGTPIKLSRTPGGTRSAPPRFNEHGEASSWLLDDELSRSFEKWAAVPNISDLGVRNGGSRMDSLGSLNAFVQAAEARSFTIAGRQLGVSSSAIDKAVARIEERLGMRIFPLRSTAYLTD
jgi:hypothetical protein